LLGVAVVLASWVVLTAHATATRDEPPTLDTRGPDDR
jgi:hypothetical protein